MKSGQIFACILGLLTLQGLFCHSKFYYGNLYIWINLSKSQLCHTKSLS